MQKCKTAKSYILYIYIYRERERVLEYIAKSVIVKTQMPTYAYKYSCMHPYIHT